MKYNYILYELCSSKNAKKLLDLEEKHVMAYRKVFH